MNDLLNYLKKHKLKTRTMKMEEYYVNAKKYIEEFLSTEKRYEQIASEPYSEQNEMIKLQLFKKQLNLFVEIERIRIDFELLQIED